MPKEYISREAALGAQNKSLNLAECRKRLERLPAADVVEVQHGSFMGTEFDGYADGNPVYYEWQCSMCGCIFEDEEPTYNYCPNCGAVMKGAG